MYVCASVCVCVCVCVCVSVHVFQLSLLLPDSTNFCLVCTLISEVIDTLCFPRISALSLSFAFLLPSLFHSYFSR